MYICDECIDLCNEIIEEELAEPAEVGLRRAAQARRDLRVPRTRLRHRARSAPRRSSPSRSTTTTSGSSAGQRIKRRRGRAGRSRTSCMIGPTGVRQDADGPDARPSCSTCRSPSPTPPPSPRPGYVGEDVENILLKLIQAADYDVKRGRAGASSTSTRSTRSPARPRTRRSPATCPARVCSRRC